MLLRNAVVRAAEAEAVYRKGLDLREVIFRLFSTLAAGHQADGVDLKHLSSVWQEGQGHASLVRSTKGFNLGWDDEPCLESLLRAVASSAIHLLTSPNVRQVRRCDGERCDWLFVDASRNHLRRWCSMDECGNRAKMHRRQLKQKLTATKD
jgi:predicted RNA-binding Zn ribbon-like protein